MLNKRTIEFLVGLFILAGIIAMFMLAFKVSDLSMYSSGGSFHVRAIFDNIGDLKVRAPITIAGVRVGEVDDISIDSHTFKANVSMLIDKSQDKLPTDTTAKILTAGIIGANYIELIPGYSETFLKNGDLITDTQPAIILENLIGQLIYKLGGDKK
ncbi:MAG: outer membrane lipid asymmetry maintenance protein MlaD [Coxiellaceae bacterium]|jgi:phospholipid/cholesterol/gamma-HCH transport system substrate-binding protein|nr:outer membrane lipid asymmetry maintenance protein MlaD [Coxiellaceae bacterium]